MEISLNPEIEQLITRHVNSGEYPSAADLIRTAVLLLHERSGPAGHRKEVNQTRHSPRGILADIRSYISPDDIAEVRQEMWTGFPRDKQ